MQARTRLAVEMKNGGIIYMRVTDNGRGIDAGDVGLAFMRHATSKILEAKDLEKSDAGLSRGSALFYCGGRSRDDDNENGRG